MKTIIYVDGYNLYYGRLRNTAFKWLDIRRLLVDGILKPQSPQAVVTRLKFFTSDTKTRFASQGPVSQKSQQDYHRALQLLYPSEIEIIKGFYSVEKANLPRFVEPPDNDDRAEVWRLEEKQTDVNIALHAYRDVVRGSADQVVLVSNDSDLEPALHFIRHDLGGAVKVGLIIPVEPPSGRGNRRPANGRLNKYADWTRRYIRDDELSVSLLPDVVPTRKKPIRRPEYW
ncbi:NYN domain-containing protein [Microbulbifer halophilus]|uniref:NYN domain-containing protein n=1 Tax=Microbulbifer halophilus TaxID=453963 RepID=A0ABW5EGY6_9GAMM|nr:NYN domain-containing protein [Microbulbifer halophilus]MCW8127703.1 NYN domain-containing protein [Microbulbifer halophilus]